MSIDLYGDCFITDLDNNKNFNHFQIQGIDNLSNISKDKINLRINDNDEIEDIYILKQIKLENESNDSQFSTGRLLKYENNVYSFFGSENDYNTYFLYTLNLPAVKDVIRLTQFLGNNSPVNPTPNLNGLTQGAKGKDAINNIILKNALPPSTVSSTTIENENTIEKNYTLFVPTTPKGDRGDIYTKGTPKWQIITHATTNMYNLLGNQNPMSLQTIQYIRVFSLIHPIDINWNLNKMLNYDFSGKTKMKFNFEFNLNIKYGLGLKNINLYNEGYAYDIDLYINNANNSLITNGEGETQTNITFTKKASQLQPLLTSDNNFYKWSIDIEFDINNTNINPNDIAFWITPIKVNNNIQDLTDENLYDGFLKISCYSL